LFRALISSRVDFSEQNHRLNNPPASDRLNRKCASKMKFGNFPNYFKKPTFRRKSINPLIINHLQALRLNSSDDNRIINIINQASATQVIDRFIQSLEHGTDGDGARFSLDGFVGIIAGV